MVYLINALAFAAIASIWSKTGWPNISISMFFAGMTVVNAIGAYPTVSQWLKF